MEVDTENVAHGEDFSIKSDVENVTPPLCIQILHWWLPFDTILGRYGKAVVNV